MAAAAPEFPAPASYTPRHLAERILTSKAALEGERKQVTGLPPSIRVGLNSGEVVVRSIGSDLRMDYTAVGQTTHLAARMEQAALPGTIVITADTLKLAEGWVQVMPLGPVPPVRQPERPEVLRRVAGKARRN